ncbi:hypothetical protein ECAE60S_03229 [Eoetvoesiella caeni]
MPESRCSSTDPPASPAHQLLSQLTRNVHPNGTCVEIDYIFIWMLLLRAALSTSLGSWLYLLLKALVSFD